MAMFFAFCAAKLPAVQGSCHTSLGHGKGPTACQPWLDPLDPCHGLGAAARLACLPCVNGAASVAAMLPHLGQDRYASTRLLQRCKVVDTLSG